MFFINFLQFSKASFACITTWLFQKSDKFIWKALSERKPGCQQYQKLKNQNNLIHLKYSFANKLIFYGCRVRLRTDAVEIETLIMAFHCKLERRCNRNVCIWNAFNKMHSNKQWNVTKYSKMKNNSN